MQLLRVVEALPPRRRSIRSRGANAHGAIDGRRAWTGWLAQYSSPGYYHRKNPGRTARQAYMRLHSAEMLAWLCVQLGVSDEELSTARRCAARGGTAPEQAAAFRRVVPWVWVEALVRRAVRAVRRGDPIRPTQKIETPRHLRRLISHLSVASPITDRFSARWRQMKRPGQRESGTVWYSTQHEHWLGWLDGWSGPGAYGRKNWNRSAEFVYRHVVNPQMLVYLAEASGVDRRLVVSAVNAALRNTTSMSSMSGAVRRVLPWGLVEACLLDRSLQPR